MQNSYLGRELALSDPLAPGLVSMLSHVRYLAFVQRIVVNFRQQLRSGRWKLAVRTGCRVEDGGNVVVEGRGIVLDAAGNVRGYAEASGTEDSAGVWKLYYDGSLHLRVAVFSRHSIGGQSAEGVMIFDASGRLERCAALRKAPPRPIATRTSRQGMPRWIQPWPKLFNPACAAEPAKRNCTISGGVGREPKPSWGVSKCDTPYALSR